jgi:chromosome segregation ATPase
MGHCVSVAHISPQTQLNAELRSLTAITEQNLRQLREQIAKLQTSNAEVDTQLGVLNAELANLNALIEHNMEQLKEHLALAPADHINLQAKYDALHEGLTNLTTSLDRLNPVIQTIVPRSPAARVAAATATAATTATATTVIASS